MKLFSKKKYPNGQREFKLFGRVVFSYNKNINKISGVGNVINVPQGANLKYTVKGNNNKININSSLKGRDCFVNITINGNNNKVYINNIKKGALYITIGNGVNLPADNCLCSFGKDLSITECTGVILYENDSCFECGDDVMISHGVTFRGSDGHAILSPDNTVLNRAHSIKIGNHVWICQDVLVSKNTEIPDGCIVGTKAVVTKKFTVPNCVLAGVPAKVVKENIYWVNSSPDRLLNTEKPTAVRVLRGGGSSLLFAKFFNFAFS